jgi:adenine nucleotide transporter 17
MAKVRIQTRKKDVEESEDGTLPEPSNTTSRRYRQNEGAVDILARVLRTEGFVGWYKVRSPAYVGSVQLVYVFLKGMGAQILKAVLSQGVLFMSKEQFEQYALAIIVLYYRLSASR